MIEAPADVGVSPGAGAPDAGYLQTADSSGAPDGGYVQAVDSSGAPLCLSCQRPCGDGRFCGKACQEDFRVRSSQAYMRARVLETEQGVCQMCGLDGHQLFQRVRDAPAAQRKQILENTWLAQLSLKEVRFYRTLGPAPA